MMFYMPQKNVHSLKLSICNLNIEEVDHFNFLGLIMDKNMKWHTHVQKVANKIRNVNGILHKFKYVFPHIILIYTSLIESHINYCILLWGTNYNKIFKLQKQLIRTISLNHFKAHTSSLFESMNLLDIRDTYQLQLFKLYYKVKNCCCLPTPMTLASGGSPMFPLVVHQPASPSIWPAVPSLRRGLSTNPGATMWCVYGCS